MARTLTDTRTTVELPMSMKEGSRDGLTALGLTDLGVESGDWRHHDHHTRRYGLPVGYTVRGIDSHTHEILDRRGVPVIEYWYDWHPTDRKMSSTTIIDVGKRAAGQLVQITGASPTAGVPFDLLTPLEIESLVEELERLATEPLTVQYYPETARKAAVVLERLREVFDRPGDPNQLGWGEILTDPRLIGSQLERTVDGVTYRGVIAEATVAEDVIYAMCSWTAKRDERYRWVLHREYATSTTVPRSACFMPAQHGQLTAHVGPGDVVTLIWRDGIGAMTEESVVGREVLIGKLGYECSYPVDRMLRCRLRATSAVFDPSTRSWPFRCDQHEGLCIDGTRGETRLTTRSRDF
jgi:hypothetical protein